MEAFRNDACSHHSDRPVGQINDLSHCEDDISITSSLWTIELDDEPPLQATQSASDIRSPESPVQQQPSQTVPPLTVSSKPTVISIEETSSKKLPPRLLSPNAFPSNTFARHGFAAKKISNSKALTGVKNRAKQLFKERPIFDSIKPTKGLGAKRHFFQKTSNDNKNNLEQARALHAMELELYSD